jgi:hypothetical protein
LGELTYGALVTSLCYRRIDESGAFTTSTISLLAEGLPAGLFVKIEVTTRRHGDFWREKAGGKAWDRRKYNQGARGAGSGLAALVREYAQKYPTREDEPEGARDKLYRDALKITGKDARLGVRVLLSRYRNNT